jgi:Transposase and inactivated derivatives
MLPQRKHLPHETPSWVPSGAIRFITIACEPRGHNHLAHPNIARAIQQSAAHNQTKLIWWIHLFLIMPDHLHILLAFHPSQSIQAAITNWKRYIATTQNINWQRNFFEHRIRDELSFQEKWHYIRANPVRAGIAATPDEWQYQWTGDDRLPGEPLR